MLEPHQIKEEKDNSPLNCTCGIGMKEVNWSQSSENVRQILVNIGLHRKRVFTLKREDDNLHECFKTYILNEPAFSELLEDSYVVFQEFSKKFGTWVDVDETDTLKDGAVLNAVFFPNNIERDESNPGSIRKREMPIIIEKTINRSSVNEIIHIDFSDDDLLVNSEKSAKKVKCSNVKIKGQNKGEKNIENFEKNAKKFKKVRSSKATIANQKEDGGQEENIKKNMEIFKNNEILTEENVKKTGNSKYEKNIEAKLVQEACNKTCKSSKKINVFRTEQNSQKAVGSKPTKARNLQKLSKPNKNWYREEANNTAGKQNLNVLWAHGNSQETTKESECTYPVPAKISPVSKKNGQKKNGNKSPRNFCDDKNSPFLSKIYAECDKNKLPVPEFTTGENRPYGFSCEMRWNDKTYYGRHSDPSKVKELAAEVGFTEYKFWDRMYNDYSHCGGSWQKSPRKSMHQN